MSQDVQAIEAAVAGIAKSWSLTDSEAAALLRTLKRGAREGYNPKRVAMFLDIFEWLNAVSVNLGGPTAWLRARPNDEASNLEKMLSGRLEELSEVHRELAKHAFFGCSPP